MMTRAKPAITALSVEAPCEEETFPGDRRDSAADVMRPEV